MCLNASFLRACQHLGSFQHPDSSGGEEDRKSCRRLAFSATRVHRQSVDEMPMICDASHQHSAWQLFSAKPVETR